MKQTLLTSLVCALGVGTFAQGCTPAEDSGDLDNQSLTPVFASEEIVSLKDIVLCTPNRLGSNYRLQCAGVSPSPDVTIGDVTIMVQPTGTPVRQALTAKNEITFDPSYFPVQITIFAEANYPGSLSFEDFASGAVPTRAARAASATHVFSASDAAAFMAQGNTEASAVVNLMPIKVWPSQETVSGASWILGAKADIKPTEDFYAQGFLSLLVRRPTSLPTLRQMAAVYLPVSTSNPMAEVEGSFQFSNERTAAANQLTQAGNYILDTQGLLRRATRAEIDNLRWVRTSNNLADANVGDANISDAGVAPDARNDGSTSDAQVDAGPAKTCGVDGLPTCRDGSPNGSCEPGNTFRYDANSPTNYRCVACGGQNMPTCRDGTPNGSCNAGYTYRYDANSPTQYSCLACGAADMPTCRDGSPNGACDEGFTYKYSANSPTQYACIPCGRRSESTCRDGSSRGSCVEGQPTYSASSPTQYSCQ